MTPLDEDIVNHPYRELCFSCFARIGLVIAILGNLGLVVGYISISLATESDLPRWLFTVTLPLLLIAVGMLLRSRELLSYITSASKLVLVYNDITARFAKIYFYGYPLTEAVQAEVFARLSQWRSCTWAGGGYCYETAALVMFSLRGAKTARLCYGCSQTGADHAWVEYRHLGTWWVIDLVWHSQGCAICPRETYSQLYQMQIDKIVFYQEFWQGPHASLYEILTDPNSVDQRYLLMHLSHFRPTGDYDPNGKPENIDRLMTDPSFHPATWQEVKI